MTYQYMELKIKELEKRIEALEQEPSGDLISRQAVLEMAYDMSEIDGEHFTEPCMVIDVADIQKLPSVKLPKGHWIIMGDRYIKCSECGHITKTESPDIYNFCMVCGAHMSQNPTGPEENVNIPYSMHKELNIPISECQKAYEVAIDYLRSQAKIRG